MQKCQRKGYKEVPRGKSGGACEIAECPVRLNVHHANVQQTSEQRRRAAACNVVCVQRKSARAVCAAAVCVRVWGIKTKEKLTI